MMNEQIKSDEIAPALTASEAEQMIVRNLPPIDHHGEKVEHVGGNSIRVRLPYNPVIANLTITFLRPARASDLIAEARIVRRGGRLSYLECWLKSDGETEPCAHITSTYRVSNRA